MDLGIGSRSLLDMPYIVVAEGMIEEINSLFLSLTGYEESCIIGKSVRDVWKGLLRISVDNEAVEQSHQKDCYLFDRNREVKEVTVRYSEMVISDKCVYTFQIKKNSMLEEKFPFLEMINSNSGIAVALYSVPDMILLKANDILLQHHQGRFSCMSDILGLSLSVLVPSINMDEVMDASGYMMRADRPLSLKEHQMEFPELGTRYVDISLTPYFEEGSLKYIIQTHNDVTESVMYRKILNDKNRIIEEQKNRLESILETVSKSIALVILDNQGRFFGDRKMVNNYFLPFGHKENIVETYSPGMYLDGKGKELALEELPLYRTLKGETITNERLTVKMPEGIRHYVMNSTPVFDSSGEVSMMIICGWDITDRIKYQAIIEAQRDYMNRVFNSLQLPIISLSAYDHRIKSINRSAADILKKYFGINSLLEIDDIIGRKFNELSDYSGNTPVSDFIHKLKVSRNETSRELIKIKSGRDTVYYNMIIQPILNIGGGIAEILISGVDITSEIEKRNQMEQIIKMKDEFLYLMSHEFKTPLTVINAAVQTLEYIYAGQIPDKAALLLEKVKLNVNRQLRLVDNLLDVTRINAGQLKLKKRNVDIVLLTKTITESVAAYAMKKEVDISFISKLPCKVIGVDDEKFERIMLNLLSNAIKFTPKGKKVTVQLTTKMHEDRRMVCISVKDQGVGIPEEKQHDMFKRFGQVDSSLTRPAEGSGVGLHLIKLLTDALGGDISMTSEVGKGSEFTLLIPSRKVGAGEENDERQEALEKRIIHSVATELSDIYF